MEVSTVICLISFNLSILWHFYYPIALGHHLEKNILLHLSLLLDNFLVWFRSLCCKKQKTRKDFTKCKTTSLCHIVLCINIYIEISISVQVSTEFSICFQCTRTWQFTPFQLQYVDQRFSDSYGDICSLARREANIALGKDQLVPLFYTLGKNSIAYKM